MNVYKTNHNLNIKAQELCEKLYLAAKRSKTRRFHILYDKVHRMDLLEDSWEIVKENKGCAGADGVSIGDIMKDKVDEYLSGLQNTLIDTHNYHPQKIKRVNIPKADGKQRPLGIPTIRDRIVQTATKTIIEPIFEADFLDCSYGFRPGKSAHDALEKVRKWVNCGYGVVLDADIKGYFDNINHEKLLEFVKLRINDRKVLKLINKWLKCGAVGELKKDKGSPQGGVISPLLANIYLHEFDKFWELQHIDGKLIRYADDIVLLFRTTKEAEIGMKLLKVKMEELQLTLNEEKTKIVDTRDGKEKFKFLGFEHKQGMSKRYGRRYLFKYPKKEAVNQFKEKIRNKIGTRSVLKLTIGEIVKKINPIINGWMNYFRFGNSTEIFIKLDSYVHERLALWWSKKHQKSGRRWKTDFTCKKCKESGVKKMMGNVVHWSNYSNA